MASTKVGPRQQSAWINVDTHERAPGNTCARLPASNSPVTSVTSNVRLFSCVAHAMVIDAGAPHRTLLATLALARALVSVQSCVSN